MGGGNYELEYSNDERNEIIHDYSTIYSCNWPSCSGVCGGNCGNTCENCGGGCGSGCSTGCTSCSGCSGCGSGCSSGCSGSCTGCQGCSGCGGCDTACTTTCKTTCQGLCTGAGAKVGISGSVKTAKFYTGISGLSKRSYNQYISINGIIKTIVSKPEIY